MRPIVLMLPLMLVLVNTSFSASHDGSERVNSRSPDIIELRDTYLARQFTDSEFLSLLEEKEARAVELEESGIDGQALFLLAYVEYYRGLLFVQYNNKSEATTCFDNAVDYLNQIPGKEDDSEVQRFYAEIKGQKMLLGGVGAIVANSLSLRRYLERSLELDPANRKAEILFHLDKVYSLPLLGRNFRKAEILYTRFAADGLAEGGDPWEAYFAFLTLGVLEEKRNNRVKALEYYLKALDIYKQNYSVCSRILEMGYSPEEVSFDPPEILIERM